MNVDLLILDEGDYIDLCLVDSEGNCVGNYFFLKDMNYSIVDVECECING